MIERIERLRRNTETLRKAGPGEREPEAAEGADDGPDGRPEMVGALVESMLTTVASDEEIVSAVRERFPDARPTRRSVASAASAMWRDGTDAHLSR